MTIDIRSKLQSREAPVLVIGDGVEVTVSNDAVSLLCAMEALSSGDKSPKVLMPTLKTLFSDDDIEKIKAQKLDFDALMTLTEEAISAAMGGASGDEKNA